QGTYEQGLGSKLSRFVEWDNFALTFVERDGRHEFVNWVYSTVKGNRTVTVARGLTLGISADQYRAAAPPPLSPKAFEGSDGLCFTDNGQPLCAIFDPPWLSIDPPPTGTVVAYEAGEQL